MINRAGGQSPHSASARWLTDTTLSASRRSKARTARCCGPPKESNVPERVTRRGPSTPYSRSRLSSLAAAVISYPRPSQECTDRTANTVRSRFQEDSEWMPRRFRPGRGALIRTNPATPPCRRAVGRGKPAYPPTIWCASTGRSPPSASGWWGVCPLYRPTCGADDPVSDSPTAASSPLPERHSRPAAN